MHVENEKFAFPAFFFIQNNKFLIRSKVIKILVGRPVDWPVLTSHVIS
jgi:hypothetical protein